MVAVSGEVGVRTPRLLVTMAREAEASDGLVDRIAVELGRAGLDVELAPPSSVTAPERYDAIVLGSEVVAGRWHASARTLARRIRDEAPDTSLWLFSDVAASAGGSSSADGPGEAEELASLTGACGHRAFTLARTRRPGTAGGPAVAATTAAGGDHAAVVAWATAITEQLRSAARPSAVARATLTGHAHPSTLTRARPPG